MTVVNSSENNGTTR